MLHVLTFMVVAFSLVTLLLSFLFFLSVQHPHLLGRKVARCVRVGCVGFIWIVTALIWLFLIRWDDKSDGLDGSDLEDPSE